LSEGMRALLAVFAVFALFSACVVADHRPYRYTVDLDEPADKRFKTVVWDLCNDDYHRESTLFLLNQLRGQLIAALAKAMGGEAQLFYAMENLLKFRGLSDVWDELSGISHYFSKYCHEEFPAGELATLNLLYQVAMPYIVEQRQQKRDLFADDLAEEILASFGMACTSIVAANSTGHVIHGRNLDWINAELYQPLTSEITYVKDGKIVAVTTSFFPELAPTTLVSKGFGFSYNARVAELQYNGGCLGNFSRPLHMDPFQLQIRKKAFEGVDYSRLLNLMSTSEYCAPAYMVISGPGNFEGALITSYLEGFPTVKLVNTSYEDEDDPRPTWFVAVCNDETEYSMAINWTDRFNQTLDLMSSFDQDEFTSSYLNLDSEVLNVSGIRRYNDTCYMACFDVLNFEDKYYKVVVRSNTVSEDQFNQNITEPPEDSSSSSNSRDSSKSSSSSKKDSSSKKETSAGAKQSYSAVMCVLIAVCAALLSLI